MYELLELLRARVRRADDYSEDTILLAMLQDAEAMILGYCAREQVPEGCKAAHVRLAQALYNRRGMEGGAAIPRAASASRLTPCPRM